MRHKLENTSLEYISFTIHIEQKPLQYIGIITCNTLGKYNGIQNTMGPTNHMIGSQMVILDWTNSPINYISPSVNPRLDHNEGQ